VIPIAYVLYYIVFVANLFSLPIFLTFGMRRHFH